MQDFEKLGLFYLGREYDLLRGASREELLLYDAKDLVTHAVCVGMTGSGKTGLCLGLLEEAAIDGIPALVVDPKGDLANLLLTFPELAPADFLPWVDADAARRANQTAEDFAASEARHWKEGLAAWGQDGARIAKLRASADVVVYTPGSTAGLPVSILSSLGAPPEELREDGELFNERIASTVTSLLGLLELDLDPIQSREHILLSTLLGRAWSAGKDLDLAALIHAIQEPGVAKIGVLDVESFYPAKERFQLALRLNNLLASPTFASWMEGEPLDVRRMLHTAEGKPRVAIFSIAHLTDAERMFFVSLLLNQTLAWMRQQTGTSSLRALFYMDEIFGYFPPTANPPSKRPLLLLLKQARAFGLGVVLATQNPVDLDYKGLANCGTWFIGRLQTERDKLRVLDGLEGAAAQGAAGTGAGFDRAAMDRMLSRLGKRVFLMNDVHEAGPVVFETRWTMSYLRGPMTRAEIKRLMEPRKTRAASATDAPSSHPRATALDTAVVPAAGTSAAMFASARTPARSNAADARPVLAPDIAQCFLPVRSLAKSGATLVYRPALYAAGRVYYSDAKLGVDRTTAPRVLVRLGAGAVTLDWESACDPGCDEREFDPEPRAGAAFEALPPEAGKKKSWDAWRKSSADYLYRSEKLELLRSPALGLCSRPGEAQRDFVIRLREAAREERDTRSEKLRAKYAPKLATLDERLRRARQAVEKEQEQARDSKVGSVLSFGVSLMGAFLGRKTISAANASRAATAARSVGRSMKEAKDVERATETVEAALARRAELEHEFQDELAALAAQFDPESEQLETLALKPKKTNVTVELATLAWAPYWRADDGTETPAWT
ncbi:MAG: ATP-binding protein [Planctomycetes bacterium]|nr:ATP-binding protein [Planctomycetota bacterium]